MVLILVLIRIVFLIVSESTSHHRFSRTLLKVEFRSNSATEDHREKTLSGSLDVLPVGPPSNHPKAEKPQVEAERIPAEPMQDTRVLVLDTFVCRHVASLIQCYSPTLRQCVVLKNRSMKLATVLAVQCTRAVLDGCFPFEKFCEL